MGEAKRRGTYEQRKEQAIKRNEEAMKAKNDELDRMDEARIRARKPRKAGSVQALAMIAAMSIGKPL